MARLPVRWPYRSLIFFKPSRSKSRTAKLRPVRRERWISRFEHLDQTPMIREASEWIGSGELADLIEELGVIEQRSAENDHVTHHHHEMREGIGSVEMLLGLAHGDVAEHVESRRDKQRAIQIGSARLRRRAYPIAAAR